MPVYKNLIGDVRGYWTPQDGSQLLGTVLQVGWDIDGELAVDIQPQGESSSQDVAPIRVRIGDKHWKDWSEADPDPKDLVRITYREIPLMLSENSPDFETEQKTTVRYEIEVLEEIREETDSLEDLS